MQSLKLNRICEQEQRIFWSIHMRKIKISIADRLCCFLSSAVTNLSNYMCIVLLLKIDLSVFQLAMMALHASIVACIAIAKSRNCMIHHRYVSCMPVVLSFSDGDMHIYIYYFIYELLLTLIKEVLLRTPNLKMCKVKHCYLMSLLYIWLIWLGLIVLYHGWIDWRERCCQVRCQDEWLYGTEELAAVPELASPRCFSYGSHEPCLPWWRR